jgi:hypothetical protein
MTTLRETFDDFGFHLAVGAYGTSALLTGVGITATGTLFHPLVLANAAVHFGSLAAVLRLRKRRIPRRPGSPAHNRQEGSRR